MLQSNIVVDPLRHHALYHDGDHTNSNAGVGNLKDFITGPRPTYHTSAGGGKSYNTYSRGEGTFEAMNYASGGDPGTEGSLRYRVAGEMDFGAAEEFEARTAQLSQSDGASDFGSASED